MIAAAVRKVGLGVEMEATDLRGVNLLDADLFFTDLTKTTGLIQAQVNKRPASI